MEETMLLAEAILFSSGRSMGAEEIAEACGLETGEIRRALRKLAALYRRRNGAIKIVRTGGKYSMQLRKDLADRFRSYSPSELPRELLQTAALIAYYQPVLQSELARKRGDRVYAEIAELRRMGLISVRQKGRTFELTTNMRFAEFFGIEAKNSEEIKEYFEKLIAAK